MNSWSCAVDPDDPSVQNYDFTQCMKLITPDNSECNTVVNECTATVAGHFWYDNREYKDKEDIIAKYGKSTRWDVN